MIIKILVATHKVCDFPKETIYLPVQVGKSLHPEFVIDGCQPDDKGDNISSKNPYYSELTAMYWAWKNLDADFVGLAHYRRHFCLKKKRTKWDSVLNSEEAHHLCSTYDIILPQKRNLYIETVYSHYDHTFSGDQFIQTRSIIDKLCPEYL